MLAKHIRILVNPGARSRRGRAALLALRRQPPPDVELEWVKSRSPEHFQDLVRAAQRDNLDALGLAGGDGTVACALNGLDALNRVPIGILPVGSDNDFARALGIPLRPADAMQFLCAGAPQRIDLGLARWEGQPEGRRFCCLASVGLEKLAFGAVQHSRWPHRLIINACGALHALWHYRPRPVRVAWRGGSFEGDVLFVAVANTSGHGGGLLLHPDARPQDGLLDLCLVKCMDRLRLLTQFPRFLQGSHAGLAEVVQAQTPWVRIEGVGTELRVSLDGDAPRASTPIDLHCEPAAVQLLVPQLQAEATSPAEPVRAVPAFVAGL